MKEFIYVDNAATTPVSPKVLQAMLPYFTEIYSNASAIYDFGLEAKIVKEDARRKIGAALGARDNEIFFTSGGTESDNWALHGVAELRSSRGKHIITSAIEHSAVLHTAEKLEAQGFEVTYLPVDKNGQITPSDLVAAIRPDTILVSIMLANNEIGTILPIKELCNAVKMQDRQIIFHTDAVQAAGHIPLDVNDLGVDLLSLSAHKFNGPKGIGALYAKVGKALPPYITGGGQERGRRSGTDNIPGIVGMAEALDEAVKNFDVSIPKIAKLRNRLIDGVLKIPGAHLTGDPINRLPGTASFVFDGLVLQPIVKRLGDYGICASAGSACSAGSGSPARVLVAAGYSEEMSTASLRMSLSENNTEDEIAYIIEKVEVVIGLLRTEKNTFVSSR